MSDNASYFRMAHPFWMVLITFGLYLLTMARFYPDKIPEFLGPVGQLGRHVGIDHPEATQKIFIGAVVLHVLESLYAYVSCRKKMLTGGATLMWTLQTLLFGVASLIKLRRYNPKPKSLLD